MNVCFNPSIRADTISHARGLRAPNSTHAGTRLDPIRFNPLQWMVVFTCYYELYFDITYVLCTEN